MTIRYYRKPDTALWMQIISITLGVATSLVLLFFSFLVLGGSSTDSTVSGIPPALASASLSPTVLYVGTFGDGIFRSTDHGATWQPASMGITLPVHVQGGLAVNLVMPTVLFARDVTANPEDETNSKGRLRGPPFLYILVLLPLSHKVEFVESDRFTVIGEWNH